MLVIAPGIAKNLLARGSSPNFDFFDFFLKILARFRAKRENNTFGPGTQPSLGEQSSPRKLAKIYFFEYRLDEYYLHSEI
jgi:hypothetical protein